MNKAERKIKEKYLTNSSKSQEQQCTANAKTNNKKKIYVKSPEKSKKLIIKRKKIKRKLYSNNALEQAITAVKDGASYRKAGDFLGVPSATLFRKINNTHLKASPGPNTVLTKEEEDEIEHWIIYRGETGSPVTKEELFKSVQSFLNSFKDRKSIFKDNLPGKKWYESFRKRHPKISLRTPQNLPLCRALVTEDKLRSWFSEVESYLVKKNLKNIQASRVFNRDESNFEFCPKPPKVLVEKGAKSVYKVDATPERENITTIFMYNAEGARVKPMTLFKYQESIPAKIIRNAPLYWSLGMSDSGWMTTETFYEYVTNIFYPYLIAQNIEFPVLLYLDGHASHVTVPLVSFCREKNIEIICLYPHSTHITQPLDIAFFHPLKDVYKKKAIPQWKNENNKDCIKKEDITCVLQLALDLFENEKEAVINSFKRAGLHPFNPDAVDYNVLKKAKHSKKKSENGDSNSIRPVGTIHSVEGQIENHSKIDNCKDFLLEFESKLSPELLDRFRACKSSQKWAGLLKYEGLFEFWLHENVPHGVTDTKDNALEQNCVNEKLELSNNNLALNLEPPRDHVETQALKSEISEKHAALDVTQNEFENVLILNESMESTQKDHDTNMSILSDILAGNIHISPVKEDKEDDPLSSEIISTNNILYASECSMSEINSLLDQKSQSNDEWQIIEIPSLISTDSISIDGLVDNNNQCISSENTHTSNSIKNNQLINENIAEESKVENKSSSATVTEPSTDENFKKSFTLPVQYLPQKKRIKLEKTGKKKAPSVGTSDEWMNLQLEKERKIKEKQDRLTKKKELQQKKKELAEHSKQLQAQINVLSKEIKQEK